MAKPLAYPGRFVQDALLPGWLLLGLAGLGLLLGLLLAFALPDRTRVPSVTGARSAIEAEAILREAGLELGNRFGRPPSEVRPGTVLAQVPAAGTEVDEGSAVSIAEATSEPETTQAGTSSGGAVLSAESTALIALLPVEFRARCGAVAGGSPLRTGSVYCVNSDGIELFAYQFASQADLDSAYAARVTASAAVRDAGECGVDAVAESSFATDDGITRGRVVCTVENQGTPLVIWTVDERLIQVEARWQRSAAELAEWWRDKGRALALTTVDDPSVGADAESPAPTEHPAPPAPAAPGAIEPVPEPAGGTVGSAGGTRRELVCSRGTELGRRCRADVPGRGVQRAGRQRREPDGRRLR